MRFMMLMIPRGYETAAPGAVPDAAHVAAMTRYNQALKKAGVLLALDGLHPPSTGARVSFKSGWASRCPALDNEIIEVRQVFEMSDFPPDVRKAAENFEALQGR